MARSRLLSRRDFVKLVTAGVAAVIGAVVGLPLIGYLIHPALKVRKVAAWIPLGQLGDFEVGQPTLVHFTRPGAGETMGDEAVYVVRRSEQDVVVFSNLCTHLACRVNWRDDLRQYVCPCHDGRFDPAGDVISGPPRRPLKRYDAANLKVEDGILYLYFEEG